MLILSVSVLLPWSNHMPHSSVSAAGAALPAAHFIQVTPSMRRAIEALVDDLFLEDEDGAGRERRAGQ